MKKSQKQQAQPKIVDPKTNIAVGDKVKCKWKRDGLYHPAVVIDIKLPPLDDQQQKPTQFYVHYTEFDRRLDEWVHDDSFDLTGGHDASGSGVGGGGDGSMGSGGIGGGMGDVESGDEASPSHPHHEKVERKITRTMKRKLDGIHHVAHEAEDPQTVALEKEHEEITKVKNIEIIELGKYEIDTWYFSPYPEEFTQDSKKLYICEFCLKYMMKPKTMERHRMKCQMRHPPGDEIYRNESLSMFEVDGKKQKIYCQNLCLLAKLFLDHKTLYYDVEPFLFYVMTECDEYGCHIVGYFSKEKHSADEYNLACILTLPPHQRKGYGKLLISFSYELSKKEEKVGSPEKPLSDLGKVSYRSYWKQVLLDELYRHKGNLSIKDLSKITAIKIEDIIDTLSTLNILKYWKGQYIISVTPKVIEQHMKRGGRDQISIDPSKIHWTPPNHSTSNRGTA